LATLAARVQEIQDAVDKGKKHTPLSEEEQKKMMQTAWLATNQKLLAFNRMGCADMCAICVPNAKRMEKGADVRLKSFFVERSKGYVNATKMTVVGPVDALGGAVKGAVAGVALGVGTGVGVGSAVGIKTQLWINKNETIKVPGHILGAFAGITTGAVTAAAFLTLLSVPMTLAGAFKGAGWTGKLTKCSRVGFEAFVDGESDEALSFKSVSYSSVHGLKLLRQAMHYDKEWFKQKSSPNDRRLVDAQTVRNYAAISHCEYMRLRKFDVRHVLECMKHEMLCGGEALLLPANDAASCRDKSDAAKLEFAASQGESDALSEMWTEAKERGKERGACVKLLCKYSGFNQGALKTHPDKVQNKDLTDPEKEALVPDFVRMSSCTERFQTADGEALTLNSEEERSELCETQDED